ncbi:MAG: YcaO-like family protein [Deltaproteobacteria bacterium]|nr:YcaO-like family protein [Deltaproteobacteria bacterium]
MAKVFLQNAFKGFTLDQDKVLPPEETVRRFRERLKAVDLDILERTVRIDNGRLDIPVYFSVCGRDARKIIGTKKQMGKGGTPEQAEASAVMELAERFSLFSFFKNRENFFVDTYEKVADRAVPFEVIARSVHGTSEDLNNARQVFSRLPLQWTQATNLTRHEEVLIPFNWFFAINEFNGPSAGNCTEEALSQGICEVVERHVSSLVSRSKMKTPAIRLDSVTDPVVVDMLGKYRKNGVRLFASDFSLDTGIPSVGVLAYDPATFPDTSEIVWTAGTTPNPQKALSRALTEVAQLSGDFNSSSNYVASGLPKLKSIDEADFVMYPDEQVDIAALPDLSSDNIRVEVEGCIAALARLGLDVLVVDVTHPRLQIPAYYTIIPGAHFRERAAGTSVGMFSAKLITETRDPRRAFAELRHMDALLPGKYYIQFYLGSCSLKLGDPAAATAFFQQALVLEPNREDRASIYSYLGQALKARGQYSQALDVLEQALACDTERTDVHNLMGFCYFKLKEYRKAIQCFQEVLRLDPTSAIDYANIAANYRDLGETQLAVAYYEHALHLDPSIDFAREALRDLQAAETQ